MGSRRGPPEGRLGLHVLKHSCFSFDSSQIPSPPIPIPSLARARSPPPLLGARPRLPPPFLSHKVYLQQKGARSKQPRGREREPEREREGRQAGRLAGTEPRNRALGSCPDRAEPRCSESHRPKRGPVPGVGAEAGGTALDGADAARGLRNLSRGKINLCLSLCALSPQSPSHCCCRSQAFGPRLLRSFGARAQGGVGRGSPRPAPPE